MFAAVATCGAAWLRVLPALGQAGGLVQGVSEDGVLLLQPGQLSVGTVLQLLLQTHDLFRLKSQLAKHATHTAFHLTTCQPELKT